MVSDWKHKTVESESGTNAQKGEAESSCLLQMDSRSRSQLRLTIHAVCKKSPHSCQGTAIASGELERTFPLLNSVLTGLKEIRSQMGRRQEAICFLDIIQVLLLYVSPRSLSQQRRAGTGNIFPSGGI